MNLARPLAAWTVLACCGVAVGAAQVQGRWALTLENGGPSVRGELKVAITGQRLDGSLLLEWRDATWLQVTGRSDSSRGTFELNTTGGEQFHLDGRATADGLEGNASSGTGLRYRWRARRLEQADEFYASSPRFLMRQMLVGVGPDAFRVPGSWLAAARAAGETVDAMRGRYHELANQAGLTPVSGDGAANTLRRAMGLLDRARYRENTIRALEAIRAGLVNDTVRARFDYLFRPAGEWLVDIHDVALARGRRPFPTLTLASVGPALLAMHLVPSDSAPRDETVFQAVYRLFTLSRSDSAGFHDIKERMQAAEPASGAAVLQLLRGYDEAAGWYGEVMRFFLQEHWIADPSGHRSLADLVRGFWGDELPIPVVEPHVFGYPEGASRVAVDSGLLAALVLPRNAPAFDWLKRNGTAGLFEVLGRLEGGIAGNTSLDAGGERFELSTLAAYRRTAFNGFLEPRDVILLDPSYEPLLAVGTLVHEWQHIAHEHRRARYSVRAEARQVTFTYLDPFLAEGLAEWATEEILEPLSQSFPLVALGEAEKRVSLGADDTHVQGYLMIRTLARTVASQRELLRILVEHGSDPAAVLREPVVRGRWARYSGPDRVVARRGVPVLLPETEFLVEDRVPDVVATRIRVGGSGER